MDFQVSLESNRKKDNIGSSCGAAEPGIAESKAKPNANTNRQKKRQKNPNQTKQSKNGSKKENSSNVIESTDKDNNNMIPVTPESKSIAEIDLRSELIKSMKTTSVQGSNHGKFCGWLEKVASSPQCISILNHTIAVKLSNKHRSATKSNQHLLRIAVETKNFFFVEKLIAAGAKDVISPQQRGKSAMSQAAVIADPKLIALIGSTYDDINHSKPVQNELAHSFISYMISSRFGCIAGETLVIDILKLMSSLAKFPNSSDTPPIRLFLDTVASLIVKGNFKLHGKRIPSLVHLIAQRHFPVLLRMVLSPVLPSTLWSQVQSITTDLDEFRTLYMNPRDRDGSLPEISALELCYTLYCDVRGTKNQTTKKQTGRDYFSNDNDSSSLSYSSDCSSEAAEEAGRRQASFRGKGKKGKGKGKGGNLKNQAVPPNKKAHWLCLLIVSEATGITSTLGSVFFQDDDVLSEVISYFGIERVLQSLKHMVESEDDTEDKGTQIVAVLSKISNFRILSQRDKALNLRQDTHVRWLHFIRAIEHESVRSNPLTKKRKPNEGKVVEDTAEANHDDDWAATPFLSPQKVPKPVAVSPSSPIPSALSSISSAPAPLPSTFLDNDDYWMKLFCEEGGEGFKILLRHVGRGLAAPPPHIIPFTEEEEAYLKQLDTKDQVSNERASEPARKHTRIYKFSSSDVNFLLRALLDVNVNPKIFLPWVHIFSDLCPTYPKPLSDSLNAFDAWVAVLNFVNHFGLILLYGMTGQCEDDNGEVQENREKYNFDCAIEFCFRLLPGHAPAIAKQLRLNGVVSSENDDDLAFVITAMSPILDDLWMGLMSSFKVLRGNCYLMPERFGSLLRAHFIWFSLKDPTQRQNIKKINTACKLIPKFNGRKGHKTFTSLAYSSVRTATAGGVRVGDRGEEFIGLPAPMKNFVGLDINEDTLEILKLDSAQNAINTLVQTEPNMLTQEIAFIHRCHLKIVRLKQRLSHLNVTLDSINNEELPITVNRISTTPMDQLLSVVRTFSVPPPKLFLRSVLYVEFEDEEGSGEGPNREFLGSIGKSFFSTDTPLMDKLSVDDTYSSSFPLFVPAPGDRMGSFVVPRSRKVSHFSAAVAAAVCAAEEEAATTAAIAAAFAIDENVDDVMETTSRRGGKGRGGKGWANRRRKNNGKGRGGGGHLENENVCLRVAGRILGFSFKANCPLGVALPPALWHELVTADSYAPWEDYCLHDEVYRNGLKKLLELNDDELQDLDLRFTVTEAMSQENVGDGGGGGIEDVELIPGGKDIMLKSKDDAKKYVNLAARQRLLRGCDVASLRAGFLDVIPAHVLAPFTPQELCEIMSGPALVDVGQWRRNCSYESDLSASHPLVRMFWSCVGEHFSEEERRGLLVFWSGSSVAPVFGLDESGSLDEDECFTLGLLHSWSSSNMPDSKKLQDSWCPEVSTCDRTMSIPYYSSKKAMLKALRVTLKHGAMGYDRC